MLASWLREWSLDARLKESAGMFPAARPSPLGIHQEDEARHEPLLPYDGQPESGDIRLLSPWLPADCAADRYIAILGWFSADLAFVLPFSRLPVPCGHLEVELPSIKTTLPWRVASVWNHLSVHRQHLDQSWLVSRLDDDELNRLREACRHYMLGSAAVDGLGEESGTKRFSTIFSRYVILPDNPVASYCRSEYAVFEPLLVEPAHLVRSVDLRVDLAASNEEELIQKEYITEGGQLLKADYQIARGEIIFILNPAVPDAALLNPINGILMPFDGNGMLVLRGTDAMPELLDKPLVMAGEIKIQFHSP